MTTLRAVTLEPAPSAPPAAIPPKQRWSLEDAFWILVVFGTSISVYTVASIAITDYIIGAYALAFLAVARLRLPQYSYGAVFWMGAYVFYVALCNATWASFTGETDFFRATAFVAFNTGLFMFCLGLMERRREMWLRATLVAFSLIVGVLFVLSFVLSHRSESGRLELFFNNPNQLAYHILLSTTIVTLLSRELAMSRPVLILVFIMAAYLEYKTYSRAGIIGITILMFFSLFQSRGRVLVLGMAVLLLGLYFDYQAEQDQIWETRIAKIQNANVQDYYEDRFIDRLIEHPKYLVFGAGEGYLIRFHPQKAEIHSSFANLLFSYGAVGTLLFFIFIWQCARRLAWHDFVLLLPSFTYGMFHNGLRARPFWILTAVALIVGAITHMRRDEKPKPATLSPRSRSSQWRY